jgi:hypothetical protein
MEHINQDSWCDQRKYQKLYQKAGVSKLFMAKYGTRYFGFVCRPRLKKRCVIPNCLNYCKMFITSTKFGNVTVRHIIQPNELLDRDKAIRVPLKIRGLTEQEKGEFSL